MDPQSDARADFIRKIDSDLARCLEAEVETRKKLNPPVGPTSINQFFAEAIVEFEVVEEVKTSDTHLENIEFTLPEATVPDFLRQPDGGEAQLDGIVRIWLENRQIYSRLPQETRTICVSAIDEQYGVKELIGESEMDERASEVTIALRRLRRGMRNTPCYFVPLVPSNFTWLTQGTCDIPYQWDPLVLDDKSTEDAVEAALKELPEEISLIFLYAPRYRPNGILARVEKRLGELFPQSTRCTISVLQEDVTQQYDSASAPKRSSLLNSSDYPGIGPRTVVGYGLGGPIYSDSHLPFVGQALTLLPRLD